jgi:hypothetical protein
MPRAISGRWEKGGDEGGIYIFESLATPVESLTRPFSSFGRFGPQSPPPRNWPERYIIRARRASTRQDAEWPAQDRGLRSFDNLPRPWMGSSEPRKHAAFLPVLPISTSPSSPLANGLVTRGDILPIPRMMTHPEFMRPRPSNQ